MRGGIAILVTFLVCLVVVALYYFIGRTQMNAAVSKLDAEIAVLDGQLADIRTKELEIGQLKQQLPIWLKQSKMFKNSIPAKVDDHIFFSSLTRELKRFPDVELLAVESSFGGAWLGEVKEDEQEKLSDMGIDPEVAANIRIVYYKIKLMGGFDDVLNVFENLKSSQRLYTIDQIAGPSAGGSGTITVNSQQQSTPMEFTGKLYYNLPDPVLNIDGLEELFFEALTTNIHRGLVRAGDKALDPEDEVEPRPESAPPADAVTDEVPPAGEASPAEEPSESQTKQPVPETAPGPAWQGADAGGGQLAWVIPGSNGSATKEDSSDG